MKRQRTGDKSGANFPQGGRASGQPAVRRVPPLSLTFDHRVVTGGEAARFLVALKSELGLTSWTT
jgi:pyruvate/2-oxoglutarate dehydrogenase complex dihydrolipoamide acyltransferase (E2) component